MRPFIRRSLRAIAAIVALVATTAPGARSDCPDSLLLAAPIPLFTGPNAHYTVVADFNEDGIPDLAVTNGDLSPGSLNASLAVRLGTGNRTFAGPVLYPVGHGARGVVAADFNEDGITDLAVANLFSNTVSVLIGQGTGGVGNGTFAPAVNYPTGAGPYEIVAADFNRDGILDLATALNGASAVCVLQGLGSGGVGNGTFGSFATFPVGNLGTGLATGDFNRDGIPDLVATEYTSGTVGVLIGTGAASIGAGSFLPVLHYPAGVRPYHIVIADFNTDGYPDLAVANTGDGGVNVLLGVANGSFALPTVLASGNSSAVAAADLNRDGLPDLVTGIITGANTGGAEVYLGNGNGTFGPVLPFATPGDVYQVVVSDLDLDGAPDVVVAEGNGNYVDVLFGACHEVTPDRRAPVLAGVRDVPNDNGGKVLLTWSASSLDTPGGAVNAYRVWRRIPPAMVALATPARLAAKEVIALPASGLTVYWEALATLPAQRLAGYGYTAATLQDSLPGSNPYTAFFVSALTSNIDVFYSSNVDSGYSVDNLKPHTPGPMAGAVMGPGFSLHWGPSPDADLAGYRLYRGATANFVPSPATLIATPPDTTAYDVQGHGEWYYKVSAVDLHANESGFSALAPLVPTGAGLPGAALSLDGVRPNPSVNGRLSISFSLAGGSGARLEVVDVAGRRLVSRDLTSLGPGGHVLTIGDGKPLASGVYFVRLIEDQRTLETRAIVTQ